MKKIIFFIPAIIFIIFLGGLMIVAYPSIIPPMISPIIYLWIGLFIISGILLSKGFVWGGLLGILPSIHLMSMSAVDTGQIIHVELPVGITITVFYLLCCSVVLYKKRKIKSVKDLTL